MHPFVEQATPGQCPKCGMALVLQTQVAKVVPPPYADNGLGVLTWRNYLPLVVILTLILLVTLTLSWSDYQTGSFNLKYSTIYFMTGFFITFAGFKLMDLQGFAEGYSTYDLLAQRWFAYGYIYPFIELAFGLLMLAGFHHPALLLFEILVMSFSGLGVSLKLAKGEEFQCACLGTFLKVPLTKITLVEDFGMAILALIVLSI